MKKNSKQQLKTERIFRLVLAKNSFDKEVTGGSDHNEDVRNASFIDDDFHFILLSGDYFMLT